MFFYVSSLESLHCVWWLFHQNAFDMYIASRAVETFLLVNHCFKRALNWNLSIKFKQGCRCWIIQTSMDLINGFAFADFSLDFFQSFVMNEYASNMADCFRIWRDAIGIKVYTVM